MLSLSSSSKVFSPAPTAKDTLASTSGEKMQAAKNAPGLSWIDFDSVEKGRVARNDLAHRAKLASKNECRAFIEAVEVEFRNWGLIS